MDGIQLTSPELYYLLSTLEAPAVVGVDNARLYPSDAAARQARLAEGLELLKAHGWLKPAEKPGRYDLSDSVMLLTAVVADPEYVIMTARSAAGQPREVVNHYLAAQLIVELTVTPDDLYQLALVPDLGVLLERTGRLLGLPAGEPASGPAAQLDSSTLAQVAQAPPEQAAELLERHGLEAPTARSLAAALAAQAGMLAVLRPIRGEVVAGRRVEIYRNGGGTWLVWRPEPNSPQVRVQAGGQAALADLVTDFRRSLPAAPAPTW